MTACTDAGVDTFLAIAFTISLTGCAGGFGTAYYWRERAHAWEDTARRRTRATTNATEPL